MTIKQEPVQPPRRRIRNEMIVIDDEDESEERAPVSESSMVPSSIPDVTLANTAQRTITNVPVSINVFEIICKESCHHIINDLHA